MPLTHAVDCSCGHQHELGTALWHRVYRRWHAHAMAGNRRREAFWGWLADRIVRWA